MKYKKGMPSVATVCNNCGFISNHSLGALGLLEVSTQLLFKHSNK